MEPFIANLGLNHIGTFNSKHLLKGANANKENQESSDDYKDRHRKIGTSSKSNALRITIPENVEKIKDKKDIKEEITLKRHNSLPLKCISNVNFI